MLYDKNSRGKKSFSVNIIFRNRFVVNLLTYSVKNTKKRKVKKKSYSIYISKYFLLYLQK